MKTRLLLLAAFLFSIFDLLFQHGLFWIAFQIFAFTSLAATAIILVALGLCSLMDRADARAQGQCGTHSTTAPDRPVFLDSTFGHDRCNTGPEACNVDASETVRAQPSLFPLSPAPLRPGLSRFNPQS